MIKPEKRSAGLTISAVPPNPWNNMSSSKRGFPSGSKSFAKTSTVVGTLCSTISVSLRPIGSWFASMRAIDKVKSRSSTNGSIIC